MTAKTISMEVPQHHFRAFSMIYEALLDYQTIVLIAAPAFHNRPSQGSPLAIPTKSRVKNLSRSKVQP